MNTTPPVDNKPAGAKGFYAVGLLSIGVSVDTSWRFFALRLGITDVVERVVLFSVMESALVACGWAMRAGVRRDGRPGPARLVAWALTAFAAFAAISLSGPVAGAARVLLGPVLGLVMLHLALGIEIRAARQRTTTWARVGRELRERVLSLLGLGDDHRDALARTRDRAALRAAKLALASRWTPLRTSRLRKALHASHVAHDPAQRDRMLRELGVLQHADKLAHTPQPAPWPVHTDPARHPQIPPHTGDEPHAVSPTTPPDAVGEAAPEPPARPTHNPIRPVTHGTTRKTTRPRVTTARNVPPADGISDADARARLRAEISAGRTPTVGWARTNLGVGDGRARRLLAEATRPELHTVKEVAAG